MIDLYPKSHKEMAHVAKLRIGFILSTRKINWINKYWLIDINQYSIQRL